MPAYCIKGLDDKWPLIMSPSLMVAWHGKYGETLGYPAISEFSGEYMDRAVFFYPTNPQVEQKTISIPLNASWKNCLRVCEDIDSTLQEMLSSSPQTCAFNCVDRTWPLKGQHHHAKGISVGCGLLQTREENGSCAPMAPSRRQKHALRQVANSRIKKVLPLGPAASARHDFLLMAYQLLRDTLKNKPDSAIFDTTNSDVEHIMIAIRLMG